MAITMNQAHDRGYNFDFFALLRTAADKMTTPKVLLSAVWTLDNHGRLACHWEFDLEGRLIQSG